jgi:hypothetical protein
MQVSKYKLPSRLLYLQAICHDEKAEKHFQG